MTTIRKLLGVTAVTLVAAFSASPAAMAQSSKNTTVKTAPATPTLDPNLFNVPPNYDLGTFDPHHDSQGSAGFSLPDTIDLGKSRLRFDTSRQDDIPKGGLDNSDTSPLKAGIPSRDKSNLPPSYFGFTLTTPTR